MEACSSGGGIVLLACITNSDAREENDPITSRCRGQPLTHLARSVDHDAKHIRMHARHLKGIAH